ncbi:YceI family protein [Phragmitibacter flavus]|uniref:YceI family protein n=1 Tax=Phragmitibacter flavus TaxID=2576071 RepID=A0A5R8KKG6_9BACT|nr:YceI family protein [Phragmitibacter flavus]TLD72824.1 YceI family protein [Phragmitibacter flavus]
MNPILTAIAIATVWLGLASPIFADTTTKWRGTGDITFSGTSTLHEWSGKVATEPFIATVDIDDHQQPKSLKAAAQVKATAMDTAEPDRDKKMRESMKVGSFPLITASFDTAFTGEIPPQTLPFELTLLGKAQKVEGTISNWKAAKNNKQVTFDVTFDLSLKTSNIKVPSVLLVIRVGDTIKVRATITLNRVSA